MADDRASSIEPATSGASGRIRSTLLFLFFAAFGIGGYAVALTDSVRAVAVRGWDRVPATVASSSVREDGKGDRPYAFVVQYTYTIGGRDHTGEVYRSDYEGTNDYAEALRIADQYPAGARVRAYVKSTDPTRSALEPPSLPGFWTLVISSVLLAFGTGGVWAVWRRGYDPFAAAADGQATYVTSPRVAVLISLALLGGGLVTLVLFVGTILRYADARDWPEVPCRVLASYVEARSDDDGTTYHPHIRYAYEYGGRSYVSSRYGAIGLWTNFRGLNESIIERHPPGTRAVCYVNPADPYDAVLDRGMKFPFIFFGLMPPIFLVPGLLLLKEALQRL